MQKIKEWSSVICLGLMLILIGYFGGISWSNYQKGLAAISVSVQEDRQAITEIIKVLKQAQSPVPVTNKQ